MKEQEEQPDAQAGVQFMGSNASASASPLLTGDLKSCGAGSLSCSGGSRQCTEPWAPKELSARLDVQLGTPGRRRGEGG